MDMIAPFPHVSSDVPETVLAMQMALASVILGGQVTTALIPRAPTTAARR
jgi:hypothetical protein